MSDQQNSLNQSNPDEIDFWAIFQKLWLRRGLLIIVPFMFSLLTIIGLLVTAVKSSAPIVYYVELQGIEKSRYPNGTVFSPQDMLIPDVLEVAVKSIGLPVDDTLRAAIQVEYDVPSTRGIQLKYETKLSDKKLNPANIERMNSQLLEELKRETMRGVRIAIDYNSLGLSQDQGTTLAIALPRAWSKVYTEKFHVHVDTRLDNSSITLEKNPLVKTSDVLSARNTLRRIRHGLSLLSADSRLKALTGEAGYTSSDLQSKLERFTELYFNSIYASLFATPDQNAESFLSETQLEIDELGRNIEEINRTLVDLNSFKTQASDNKRSAGSADSVQLGDNSLKQVIDLAQKASLAEYLQKVLTERQLLAQKKSALIQEIERSKLSVEPNTDELFMQRATKEFSDLKSEYISLLNLARNVSRQIYGDFFRPLGSPGIDGSLLPKRSVLIVAAAFMLGAFIATLIALVLPSRRQEAQIS